MRRGPHTLQMHSRHYPRGGGGGGGGRYDAAQMAASSSGMNRPHQHHQQPSSSVVSSADQHLAWKKIRDVVSENFTEQDGSRIMGCIFELLHVIGEPIICQQIYGVILDGYMACDGRAEANENFTAHITEIFGLSDKSRRISSAAPMQAAVRIALLRMGSLSFDDISRLRNRLADFYYQPSQPPQPPQLPPQPQPPQLMGPPPLPHPMNIWGNAVTKDQGGESWSITPMNQQQHQLEDEYDDDDDDDNDIRESGE